MLVVMRRGHLVPLPGLDQQLLPHGVAAAGMNVIERRLNLRVRRGDTVRWRSKICRRVHADQVVNRRL